jgi:hypothetical protein
MRHDRDALVVSIIPDRGIFYAAGDVATKLYEMVGCISHYFHLLALHSSSKASSAISHPTHPSSMCRLTQLYSSNGT